ncbi:hypothetical protein [Adonisia turfae]
MTRLARERLLTVALLSCAGATAGVAAWWSMPPVQPIELDAVPQLEERSSTSDSTSQLNPSVFDLVLWPEPAPAIEEQRTTAATSRTAPIAPPPPAPISLSLVAIVEDEQGWRVALYDPSEQRLVIAAGGERVGRVLVREVTAETVLLELAGRTTRLALREDGR